jgi:hypothetical protein
MDKKVPKVEYPGFNMVFAESVPDAKLLSDPNTPADMREAAEKNVDRSIGAARGFAQQKKQKGRHTKNHDRYNFVMAEYKPGVDGEAQRLHKKFGVALSTVHRWIAGHAQRPVTDAGHVLPDNWATVWYGAGIRHANKVRRENPALAEFAIRWQEDAARRSKDKFIQDEHERAGLTEDQADHALRSIQRLA